MHAGTLTPGPSPGGRGGQGYGNRCPWVWATVSKTIMVSMVEMMPPEICQNRSVVDALKTPFYSSGHHNVASIRANQSDLEIPELIHYG